ncbi:hypothetical protein [Krasilnikovia sp. MM14-A1259]|uniref:hypothetical protein n=1 Tax=Krasilnikovia sp. MM14-A1259 TaxID=3373539 RepID=UPI00399CD162
MLLVVVLLWWKPFDEHPDVPSCDSLAKALPSAAGGTWGISEPDTTHLTQSSTRCTLAFTSTDQRFSGTTTVLLTGDTRPEQLRSEVQAAPCNGAAAPPAGEADYVTSRACTEQIGDNVRAAVIAAKHPRWTRIVVEVPTRPGTVEDAVTFSQNLARTVAHQCLTLPAE